MLIGIKYVDGKSLGSDTVVRLVLADLDRRIVVDSKNQNGKGA